MIELKYGVEFHEDELIDLIKRSGRDYIVQGQRKADLADHPQAEIFGRMVATPLHAAVQHEAG